VERVVGAPRTAEPVTDRDQFSALVRAHWDDMVWLSRRLAPIGQWEDVLQNALSVAWRTRAKYDPQRASFRNWLLAVVADQARKSVRRLRPTSELIDVFSTVPPADDDVDLAQAIGRLTKRQRAAITLHYYLGLPILDVAEVMSCSVGTVKSTLSDARTRLRRDLGEGYCND
jgi:RNA polymerase sigma factor (sigma-70 family)